MFLDKKCTIQSKTFIDTNWEQIPSFATIYTNIPCDFYQEQKNKYSMNKFVSQSNNNQFYVVLEPSRINVRQWHIIELIDNTMWTYWKFLVETIEFFRNHTWVLNNIYLSVSKYNG